MYRNIIFLLAFFILSITHTLKSNSTISIINLHEFQDKNIITAELSVIGMTCQKGCADGIDKKLKKTLGVIRSKTTLKTGICKVTYDDTKTNLDQIISVINGLGYKASTKP